MSKSWKDKMKQAKSKVTEATNKTKGLLDDYGVTDKVNAASDTVGEHLDTISGAKQLQLVEERLALQSQYNDILAQKLDEALDRINELESQVKKAA